MGGKTVVCLGVCTLKRPGMLANCLRSLAAQQHVSELEVHIAVADNDSEPTSKPVVEQFTAACPFPVHYRHEPRRGIPMARNAVLDVALALNADWLAFIDDDQTARPTWLSKHLEVARRDQADAVQPHIIRVEPDPAPFWSLGSSKDVEEVFSDAPLEQRLQPSAGTCGVFFSTRLIRPDGMNLRFDERLALAGGEDTEFFHLARRQGARIVNSRLPVVEEEVARSRLTYWRYVMRGLARGGQLFGVYRSKNGYRRAARKYFFVSLVRIARGTGQLLISPIFAPFDLQRFKFTALEGGRNIFVAAGALGGMLSLQYEYYRRIDGY
jgi:succinoglycan biosynthesis protein ExoM